jgi:hypothetical protein
VHELLAVFVRQTDKTRIADEATVPLLASVAGVPAVTEAAAAVAVGPAVTVESTVAEITAVVSWKKLGRDRAMAGREGQTNTYKHPPPRTCHAFPVYQIRVSGSSRCTEAANDRSDHSLERVRIGFVH